MRYAGHPGQLGRQFPKVETMLREAADELLAFAAFPVPPWQKIRSTNPLERLNKEIKRRTDVVGVLPNPAALLRRTVAVLVEAHDAPPPLRHIHHAAGRVLLRFMLDIRVPVPGRQVADAVPVGGRQSFR